MAVLISFQNVDFSTTLKAGLRTGYSFGTGALACYFGELVKTEVQSYVSTDTKFLIYVSHFKANVNFLFFVSENEKGFIILPIPVNC